MTREFERKVAVVTGAASGIGFEIAKQFADRGAAVAVVDVDEQGATRTAEAIGAKALPVVCNVSDSGSVERMVVTVTSRLGGIDIVVNNAGVCERVSVEDLTEDQWDRVMAVALGPYGITVNAVLPGTIETDINRDILARNGVQESILSATPLRCLGMPEHIAEAVIYFASDQSGWTTGALLPVDGGFLS